MKTSESYGKHPRRDAMVFKFVISVSGKSTAYYRPVRMTKRQKRAAIKEFRAYIKSGLAAHQWHDLICKKCKS